MQCDNSNEGSSNMVEEVALETFIVFIYTMEDRCEDIPFQSRHSN